MRPPTAAPAPQEPSQPRAHSATVGLDVLVVEPSTLISQPDRPSDDDTRQSKANRIRQICLRLHHHVASG